MLFAKKPLEPRVDCKGRSGRNAYFNRRGRLHLGRDSSSHRRFAALYDDLLS